MTNIQFMISLFILTLSVQLSTQDIYLHNPRGSNNRLNEKTATRKNNNRAFDSQNNNRGGYNIGDSTSKAFTTENEQYQMKYFQSNAKSDSILKIEWTSQHGCGGNEDTDPTKLNCDLILQYTCQEEDSYLDTDLDRLRDGLNTNTQGYTQMAADTRDAHSTRKANDVKLDRVLMEPWQSYDACNYRERNAGLFTADQKLKANNKGFSSAIYTRQNPNGNRRGYECPEERDYYPYWHPTVWKDIAILTGNTSLCDYFKKESFNVKSKHLCVEKYDDKSFKHWSRWNNEKSCTANNGVWMEFSSYLEKAEQFKSVGSCLASKLGLMKWAVPYDSKTMQSECLIMPPEPICQQANFTRSNHLGNTRDGKPISFDWKLPHFPSKKLQKCAFRIRYNITTDDYAPYETDAKFNAPNSPVNNNPRVNIGANNQVLRLAINTAQIGRVFQDRSHTFLLMARPNNINENSKIYNLNVKGKRGNIVQVYPGVEYDFHPNELKLTTNDLVHIQWTGSNTHNNQPPGGDGQTGDAGEGTTGTDRSNLVQINDLNENFPLPFENTDIWKDMRVIGYLNDQKLNDDSSKYLVQLKQSDNLSKDLALYLSSSGYYQCVKKICEKSYESIQTKLDADLNTAPASFPGVLVRFTKASRSYKYMCSRNNNFSNRSQKGTINIE